MTQRVSLLNGTNINQDHDFSKIIEAIASDGVVEGLEVQSGKVTPGYAFIEVDRSGEVFRVLFRSTADVVIDTTGTKKVFVEITQANIDDGSSNEADGTGIGAIKTAASYPAGNYIPLASIDSGVITDERGYPQFRESIELNGVLLPKTSILSKSSDYTFTGSEKNNTGFATDTSGGDVTYTLDPSVFDLSKGLIDFTFRKDSSDANKIIIDAGSGNTIDGAQTYEITDQWQVVKIQIVNDSFCKVTSDANRPIFIPEPTVKTFIKTNIAGEDISNLKGVVLFSQDTADFTEDKVFGNTNQQKIAFGPFKGKNISSDEIKLFMKKTGTPSNFEIRIETDAAGVPSGTLADVNAYGSLTEASFTTSLAIVTVTLNSAIQLEGDSFWVVLGQTTNSDTDYYTIGSKDSSLYSYMQYNGTDWGLFGDTVVDTIQTSYDSTAFGDRNLEYFFTPSSNILLEKVQSWHSAYPFYSLDLYEASDMTTVLASATISGADHTFNYELTSGVQYVLKGTSGNYHYYKNISIPNVKTNLTLDSMTTGGSSTTRTYTIKNFQTKVVNVGGSEAKETYYEGDIFEKEQLLKIAKATDASLVRIEGISQEGISKYGNIDFAFNGIISGFTGLTASNNVGDPIYLQDDGSFGLTAGTNTLVVGIIYSDTEVELISRVSGESSAAATTGGVTLGNAEGYITINIPGVGNKKIAYWGV